jgi:hypothetical protein
MTAAHTTGSDQTEATVTADDTTVDVFVGVDPNQWVEPRFIPVDRDRLPLLKRLTGLYRQVEVGIAELKPARLRLGQLKGTLLDEAFVRKYPTRPAPLGREFHAQRIDDWTKAWFRRPPYQRAFLEYELAIANLAEDAGKLQALIHEIIDTMQHMAAGFERDLSMVNVQSANRLLFIAQEEHSQAVAHLKAQPNDPANLPGRPLEEALRRLTNDSDTKYWAELRRNPSVFPVKDSTHGLI